MRSAHAGRLMERSRTAHRRFFRGWPTSSSAFIAVTACIALMCSMPGCQAVTLSQLYCAIPGVECPPEPKNVDPKCSPETPEENWHVGCGGLMEIFSEKNPFDLEYTTLKFSPARPLVEVCQLHTAGQEFPVDPSGGKMLQPSGHRPKGVVGSYNYYSRVDLPFKFPFFGNRYGSVFVNRDGYIDMLDPMRVRKETGRRSYWGNVKESVFSVPRIFPMLTSQDQYDSLISWKNLGDGRVCITYENVGFGKEWGGPNWRYLPQKLSFQVILSASGEVWIIYKKLPLCLPRSWGGDCLQIHVGLSGGILPPADRQHMDFSGQKTCPVPVLGPDSGLSQTLFKYSWNLDDTTLKFSPEGDEYLVCSVDAPELPVDPTGGTVLAIFDDNHVSVDLPFAFPFMGSNYSKINVDANGYIGLGSESKKWKSSATSQSHLGASLDHYDEPRISALLADLVATQDTIVSWKAGGRGNTVAITYYSMGYFQGNSKSSFTFQIVLSVSGDVDITYSSIKLPKKFPVTVGLSGGAIPPPHRLNADLSATKCN